MPHLVVLRTLVARLLRSPAAWLVLLGLSLAWLLWLELGTHGVTTRRVRGDAALYEIAFLAGLVGSALATTTCERSAWCLLPQGPWRRLSSQALALLGGAVALQVAALGAPVALGLVHDVPALLAGSLATDIHLASLALLLLAAPIPGGMRGPLLVLLAWPMASLVPARGILGTVLGSVLGAASHLHLPGSVSHATRGDPVADIMTVGGLSLAAALLHTGPRARHEVRNPR